MALNKKRAHFGKQRGRFPRRVCSMCLIFPGHAAGVLPSSAKREVKRLREIPFISTLLSGRVDIPRRIAEYYMAGGSYCGDIIGARWNDAQARAIFRVVSTSNLYRCPISVIDGNIFP